ncbi:MAG: Fe-S cluster assembly ATPase SufC [Alphaproteobacteria bacterium]|nr:Fe-S cluster assembly ATPase SufC [Alphaproteobacteria bacterium]
MSALLEVKNLCVNAEDKQILNGLSLSINPGEIHVIVGPNGAGKSTLSNVICGDPRYQVTSGSITFKGEDLLKQNVDERARNGIFLSFQSPVEIPGISMSTLMKYALNSHRKAKGLPELDAVSFSKLIRECAKKFEITNEMLKRPVNVGFSGGEKKRLESFQMAVLEPSFCILDEMDSGMDVDAVKIAANGVNLMRSPERSFLIISHNNDFLYEQIKPDVVHVLVSGNIVETSDASLLIDIKNNGFSRFLNKGMN